MSKRFGRNQKRAARARIAQLEVEVQRFGHALQRVTNERDEAWREIRWIERDLWEYCSALEPKTMHYEGKHAPDFFSVSMPPPIAPLPGVEPGATEVRMRIARMRRLVVQLGTVDVHRRGVHVRAQMGQHCAEYMADDVALFHMSEERLTVHLAYELGRQLAHELKRGVRA